MYQEKKIAFTEARMRHWNGVSKTRKVEQPSAYQRILSQTLRKLVGPGLDILELGCGCGNLLAALEPKCGAGIDFSGEMIRKAQTLHPQLDFIEADAHEVDLGRTFDVILLSDLLDDVWSVSEVLRCVRRHSNHATRVVVSSTSRLWQPLVGLGSTVGMITPRLEQSWLSPGDLLNLFALEGFQTLSRHQEILFPVRFPVLQQLFNRFLARLPLLDHLCLCNVFVFRPEPRVDELARFGKSSVSVVVAARNEEGNLESLVQRIPLFDDETEIIFVEGGSSDGTYAEIQRLAQRYPEKNIRFFKQPGKGKGDAIRMGFAEAKGDILLILDADMTVAPESIGGFVDIIKSGRGEFVNGVRLVYPRERKSMRYFNLIANKAFGILFSWLLGQRIKDTLCGTKVIKKSDYERIHAGRSVFGDFDPFGDFDLLLGAARQNLHIVDFPTRYFERSYGETNIQRWRAGLLLLKMVWVAAFKLKFR